MLSEEYKAKIRKLCKDYDLGMITFLPGGLIRFTANYPIRTNIEKHLHNYEVIENETGEAPTMDDRPDDMKYAFWVTVRPFYHD